MLKKKKYFSLFDEFHWTHGITRKAWRHVLSNEMLTCKNIGNWRWIVIHEIVTKATTYAPHFPYFTTLVLSDFALLFLLLQFSPTHTLLFLPWYFPRVKIFLCRHHNLFRIISISRCTATCFNTMMLFSFFQQNICI